MNSAAMTIGRSSRDRLRRADRGHRNSSSVFLTRNTRSAPMLTAARRMIPSNSGCSSGGDVEDAEEEGDHPQDERAEDRADRAAGAAEQRGAADHHRGDRVQRIGAGLRDVGIAGRGLDRQEQSAASGEEAAQREGGDLGAIDVEAGHIGRAFRRADRVDGAAGDRAAERHPDDQRDHGEQHERHRDPGEGREPGRGAVVEDVHGRGKVAERIGHRPVQIVVDLAARLRAQEQCNPDIDCAGRQRRDDRLNAAIDDDRAVEQAGQRADRETDDRSRDRCRPFRRAASPA